MSKSVSRRMKIQKKAENKTSEFKHGDTLISIYSCEKQHIMRVNLGRYRKDKEVDTYTIYDSIEAGDKPYTSVWLDKQGKKVVGLEVSWE